MPPNADVSRLRNRLGSNVKDENDDGATVPTSTLNDLKGNEVCIDGVIYDLSDFDHPGGNSIRMYGGNDVTVMYRMMHPYHTEKHLEKMRKVGVVSDFKCEYEFDTEFEREIKREVFKIVRRGREFGTYGFLARAVFYILFLAVMQYAWVTVGSSFTLAIGLGVAQAFIGLNVQHDANHGAASRKAWLNDLFGFGADFIGGQKWNWMQQHTTHHAYCNHVEKDPDSFSAEPMMLFNDYPGGHPNRRFYHKFQTLYFLPVLSMYWVSMILNPQVFTLQQGGAKSVGIKMENDFLISRRKYSAALRLLYIYWNVVTPFYFHKPLLAVLHILCMGTCESLTLALLFSLSHNFVNSDRDPTAEYRKTGKKVDWFKAQVETSSTYGGAIAGYLTGGLNFQVEHHLFPRMCSAHYPYIAPTVRKICEKHGVRYAYYPWVWHNFISTVKYMHQAGTGSNWDILNPLSGKN